MQETYRYNSTNIFDIDPLLIRYEDLNAETQAYLQYSATAISFMSVCFACTVWQLKVALQLAYQNRKWINYAVLFEASLSFSVILCSLLNPLTSHIDCEMRFWLSIISVNFAGCCIQSILLYKAYLCYDRSIWLVIVGSFINLGYIALIFIYAILGKVPSFKDLIGNCVMINLEWPALAKLGLDITSNLFLSLAFLLVISRHYRVFGNSLHKTLLSNGIIFSVGVIASNIITAILISTRALGGLSADLYSFDWVITTFLLISQFKSTKSQEDIQSQRDQEEDYATDDEDNISINVDTIKNNSPIIQHTLTKGQVLEQENHYYEFNKQNDYAY